MSQKLNVAVSGIGWCGCEHLKAFQKEIESPVPLPGGRMCSSGMAMRSSAPLCSARRPGCRRERIGAAGLAILCVSQLRLPLPNEDDIS